MADEWESALQRWGPDLRRRQLSPGRLLTLLLVASQREPPLPRLEDRAARWLERVLPLELRHAGCIEAARLFKEQRQPRLALACLEPLRGPSANTPDLALLEGELLRLARRHSEAEQRLRPLLSNPGYAARAAYQLGELERSRGGFDQAARWLLQSLAGDPLDRYIHNALHYTRFSPELLPEVIRFYQELAQQHSGHSLIQHLLSHYLLRHGDVESSAQVAQQAARLDLGNRSVHLAPSDEPPTPPDFLIIGVPKGGTSSLLAWLGEHPQLWVHPRKELHFFDIGWHQGMPWYCSQFPRFKPESGFLRGEATPNYFQLPEVPARVHAVMPQARLILLLRDPVQRALSWIHHLQRHEGLQGEAQGLLLDELEQLSSMSPVERAASGFRWPNALLGSCYDAPLQRWQQLFPPHQLLVLQSESLFQNPAANLRKVAEFLGVASEWPMGSLTPFNQAPEHNPGGNQDAMGSINGFLNQQSAVALRVSSETYAGWP